MASAPPPGGTVRSVQVAIEINGTRLPGMTSFVVHTTNFRGPDTFEADLAIAALPDGFGLPFWAKTAAMTAEIFVSATAVPVGGPAQSGALKSLILGNVDHVEISLE
ncbi:MAG: hypothetical protein ACHQF3_00115 [Alphaproteobacteria bacterium]